MSQSTKKPSFLRRLSLSASNQQPQVLPSNQPIPAKPFATNLDATTHRKTGLVAGPAYDSLPPGVPLDPQLAAKRPFDAPKARGDQQREADGDQTELPKRGSSRHHAYGGVDHAKTNTITPSPTSPTRPNHHSHGGYDFQDQRKRFPIYPALASPPNSPSKSFMSGGLHSDDRDNGGVPPKIMTVTQSPSKTYDQNMGLGSSSRSSESNNLLPHRINRQHSQSPHLRASRYADAELNPHISIANPASSEIISPTRPSAPSTARRMTSSSRPVKPSMDVRSRSTSYGDQLPPTSFVSPSPKTPAMMTEASAYAKAVVSSTLLRTSPNGHGTASAPSQTATERRVSRPLPRPPSSTSLAPPSRQNSTMHVIASNDGTGRKGSQPRDRLRPALPIAQDDIPQPSSFIAFQRSPTLPPLMDPRQSREKSPVEQWTRNVSTPTASKSPVEEKPPASRSSSVTIQNRRLVSSTSLGSTFTSPGTLTQSPVDHLLSVPRLETLAIDAPPGPCTLASILIPIGIQTSLLPFLSINSFLSLTGSSESIRRRFSGETVGRWIMREWGIQVDHERGRSWPNLTVWEGFLESLLHDPSSYSTYPIQWHNLLRHLSLSHTLIVLHLRSLPISAFPNSAPLPFEDDYGGSVAHMGYSQSVGSLSSLNLPRSRVGSVVGSDAGSTVPGKMPKHERLMEIVMPEPLAGQEGRSVAEQPQGRKPSRRSSVSSLASAASFSFGRKRSNSTTSSILARPESFALVTPVAAPIVSGKTTLPPVSYPTAKRYGFKRHGDPPAARSRTFSETSRPGSVFSVQSSPSVALSHWVISSQNNRHATPSIPGLPSGFSAPPIVGAGSNRASFASSDAGRSSRPSDLGGNSPIQPRFGSPLPMRRDYSTPPPRIEPVFDRPPPYVQGRAPILRVFVPTSGRVKRWPSAEGAAVGMAELDKCGASRRLRLGDLIVNTAFRQPKTTEHVLVFVPFIKHLLVPLEYKYNTTGHLPSYVNGFEIPPSYYYPFLPSPHIIHVDLRPYSEQATRSLRLAYDRRDVTVASGARMAAKRYLHVAGFEVKHGDPAAPEWYGMVSLEAEGTAEGKAELIRRLGGHNRQRSVMAPWEVVRDKSMSGTVWLRMVKQIP